MSLVVSFYHGHRLVFETNEFSLHDMKMNKLFIGQPTLFGMFDILDISIDMSKINDW